MAIESGGRKNIGAHPMHALFILISAIAAANAAPTAAFDRAYAAARAPGAGGLDPDCQAKQKLFVWPQPTTQTCGGGVLRLSLIHI